MAKRLLIREGVPLIENTQALAHEEAVIIALWGLPELIGKKRSQICSLIMP